MADLLDRIRRRLAHSIHPDGYCAFWRPQFTDYDDTRDSLMADPERRKRIEDAKQRARIVGRRQRRNAE